MQKLDNTAINSLTHRKLQSTIIVYVCVGQVVEEEKERENKAEKFHFKQKP